MKLQNCRHCRPWSQWQNLVPGIKITIQISTVLMISTRCLLKFSVSCGRYCVFSGKYWFSPFWVTTNMTFGKLSKSKNQSWIPGKDKNNLIFCELSRPTTGRTKSPLQWTLRDIGNGVQRLGRDITSTKVMNTVSCASATQISAWPYA